MAELENCTASVIYDYEDDRKMHGIISVLVPVCFGIIFLLGSLGNVTVIAVVLGKRFRQIKNTTNLLMVNLACANLLFVLFCVPFTASDYVVSVWPFGSVWCKAVQYLIHVCAYASVCTLVLLSFDRYLAVLHPVRTLAIRTQRTAHIAIGVLWSVDLLANLPLLKVHGLHYSVHDCEVRMPCIFDFESHDEVTFRMSFLVTFYIVPIVIIFLIYLVMLIQISQAKNAARLSGERNRPKKRMTWMVVAAVMVFMLCWGPIVAILAQKAQNLYPVNAMSIAVQIAAHVLAYSYACLNPFVYVATHPGFRSGFRNLLCCGDTDTSYYPDFETTGDDTGASYSRGSQKETERDEVDFRVAHSR